MIDSCLRCRLENIYIWLGQPWQGPTPFDRPTPEGAQEQGLVVNYIHFVWNVIEITVLDFWFTIPVSCLPARGYLGGLPMCASGVPGERRSSLPAR